MWIKDITKIKGTKNFYSYEFQCKGELNQGFICCGGSMFINIDLVLRVQKIRDIINKSITINSGCRCLTFNRSKLVKSKNTSSHPKGYAADLRIPEGYTVVQFLDIIKQSKLFDRIGIYDTFIHVDIDPNKVAAIWDNRTAA